VISVIDKLIFLIDKIIRLSTIKINLKLNKTNLLDVIDKLFFN